MDHAHPSASFSATLRVHLDDRPGAFAELARAIADAGGNLGAIDLVRVEQGLKVRDVTVDAASADHIDEIVATVRNLPGVEVEHVSDRTFLLHLGGKIEMVPKAPLKTRDDLSMAYTPGVARVCSAIAEDVSKVWNLTIKQNTVAVVSDGTAVLGLGDIGPEAAMPVMEGKAVLFKEFGGVDAWPICLSTTDPDEIVAVVAAIAPGFGGINLEDISAPRCFEIESRLKELLDIPVFHDDQHGTAIVVTAAFLNALQLVGKNAADVSVVLTGVGAAGVATTDMLGLSGSGWAQRGGPQGAIPPERDDPRTRGSRDVRQADDPKGLLGYGRRSPRRCRRVYLGLRGRGAPTIASWRRSSIVLRWHPTPGWHEGIRKGSAAVVATGAGRTIARSQVAVPGRVPGGARRPGLADQRGDEARGRTCGCGRRSARRAQPRVHRAERLQPRRRPGHHGRSCSRGRVHRRGAGAVTV